MCLAEDGLIGLNRPLIDYVPELDVPSVQCSKKRALPTF